MIISKTPFRISFAGGLSDLECYYGSENREGCVVSSTIDKYLYITVNKMFDNKYRIKYSKEEVVENIEDIEHPLVRESLKLVGIDEPVEIMCTADIFGGVGLGSSSAFVVGLLNALYTYKGYRVNRYKLAEDACKIEIDILKDPIGKQDQYAAAFGGLNCIRFKKNRVDVNPILLDQKHFNRFQSSLILFYTGLTRKSKDVLNTQKQEFSKIITTVDEIANIAKNIESELRYSNGINWIGEYLGKEWYLKKQTGKVSNETIDRYYDMAIKSGALGGKLCGAGLGGFLLFYCDKDKQPAIRLALKDLKELPFKFEELGSRIIYES